MAKSFFTHNGTLSDDKLITVSPYTNNPTRAWATLAPSKTVVRLSIPDIADTPIRSDAVRFVCISDTHNATHQLPNPVPNGDILIHAGDFTKTGLPKQVDEFNNFLGKLPHRYKVVIAGNHDLTFDDQDRESWLDLLCVFGIKAKDLERYLSEKGLTRMRDVLTNCIYLQDSGVELFGLKIWGSPWQPEFCNWGFNLPRGQPCLDKWNLIPEDTQILVTHGPPIGHGDRCYSGLRAGCVELLATIERRVRPKFHIFGHIHEDYGMTTDGFTTFLNASTCNLHYRPLNPPIVFDVPLPEGCMKDDLSPSFAEKCAI